MTMTMTKTKIIAFCGPKSSGKDTACNWLLARDTVPTGGRGMKFFRRQNFADPLKQTCAVIFGLTHEEMNDTKLKETVLTRWPFVTPRSIMQKIGNTMREVYGPDVWVNAWERGYVAGAPVAHCVVITDLRFPNELEMVSRNGGTIIYIHNEAVEHERLMGIAQGDPAWTDASEQHCPMLKSKADVIIDNSGSLNALFDGVAYEVKHRLGDYKEWN